MNRLLALAVFASLGTGCITADTCDVRDVFVTWDDFQRATGTIASTCTGAGVDSVKVYVDDQLVDDFPCGDAPSQRAVTVTDVLAGRHDWRVEALSGSGAIVYRDFFTTSGDGCDTIAANTRPAAGYVDLQYLFYSGGTPLPQSQQVCTSGSLLWLSIYDDIAHDYSTAVVDRNANPEMYTCGGSLVLPLPIGDYTLFWMEERGPGGTYNLAAADCTDRPFTVYAGDGSDGTAVPVNLARDAGGACVRQ